MKPYEMHKGRESPRSCIITQPWELSVSQEEVKANSDGSYGCVMYLATRMMQAFSVNSLDILEIALPFKASERQTLTQFLKLAAGMLLSKHPKIHRGWNRVSLLPCPPWLVSFFQWVTAEILIAHTLDWANFYWLSVSKNRRVHRFIPLLTCMW